MGVTPLQWMLGQAAIEWRAMYGGWPTAAELASGTDTARPVVWAELKTLARLGVVSWRRVVEVLRAPDGVFFARVERAIEP